MSCESFVDGEEALGRYRLPQAIDDTAVKVAVLVVHSSHDRILPLVSMFRSPVMKENLTGGCMTQQTTNPLADELKRCKGKPSSIPAWRINLLFAKK